MKIRYLGTESNGTRSIEVRSNEISYRGLLRCIRKIPDARITDTDCDPINDNANIFVEYKDIKLSIETPFSDYIINCTSKSPSFDHFVDKLEKYHVKWWERFF